MTQSYNVSQETTVGINYESGMARPNALQDLEVEAVYVKRHPHDLPSIFSHLVSPMMLSWKSISMYFWEILTRFAGIKWIASSIFRQRQR